MSVRARSVRATSRKRRVCDFILYRETVPRIAESDLGRRKPFRETGFALADASIYEGFMNGFMNGFMKGL